ncbi:MAG: DinB family protein, partial [Bacteroidia bacterium]
MRPAAEDYPAYFGNYIGKTSEQDPVASLKISANDSLAFFRSLPETTGDFAYAPGKWTIKQLILHISDAERIFTYRALRFAPGDAQQPLPFEENDYAANCEAEKRSLSSVIEEFETVRRSTLSFYESLSPESLERAGQMAG